MTFGDPYSIPLHIFGSDDAMAHPLPLAPPLLRLNLALGPAASLYEFLTGFHLTQLFMTVAVTHPHIGNASNVSSRRPNDQDHWLLAKDAYLGSAFDQHPMGAFEAAK